MVNLIIPEAIRIIQSQFYLSSDPYIPKTNLSNCSIKSNLSMDAKYFITTTNADYILFFGTISDKNNSSIAFANSCVVGNETF
jgi:hypothetical protein